MEETKKYKLRGHESFCIREGWLAKGIKQVKQNPRVFHEKNSADALGIGTNMAKAIRYWLKATGLTKEKPGVGTLLTELGELVYDYDPYLEEDFTLWCLHMNLIGNKELATSWYLFFSKCRMEEFVREELERFMGEEIRKYTKKEEIALRSIKDDCGVLLQMYAREKVQDYDPEDKMICPLSRLGILRKSENGYRRTQPDLERFPVEVLLYFLCSIRKEETSVNMETLFGDAVGVHAVLGLGNSAYQECLEELSRNGYVDINRTAGLDMIYKNRALTKEEVALHYYTQTITSSTK